MPAWSKFFLLPTFLFSFSAAADEVSDLRRTANQIEEFKTMNGGYPSSLEELEPPVYSVKRDSEGRLPVYRLTGDGTSYELSFPGPDGKEGTDDDLRYDRENRGRTVLARPIRTRPFKMKIPWLGSRRSPP